MDYTIIIAYAHFRWSLQMIKIWGFCKAVYDERLSSLDNDVKRCLPADVDKKEAPCYAPFPALLYCFSVIDLLGALYAGHARSSKTVDNSKKYMNDLMKYGKDQFNILQKMFRHKMVHLAQPKPIMKDPTQNEISLGNIMKIQNQNIW